MIDVDDKDLAIIALAAIGIVSVITLGESARDIVIGVISAIAGFVTGRKLEKGG